jgi:hypothetical protein
MIGSNKLMFLFKYSYKRTHFIWYGANNNGFIYLILPDLSIPSLKGFVLMVASTLRLSVFAIMVLGGILIVILGKVCKKKPC